jgi:phage portal protein BeeE
MEFQKTKEAAAREIAMAFGVPPMLLGIPGDATYANYQEANRAFYRLTVLPLAARVTAALAHWLSGFTGRGGGAAARSGPGAGAGGRARPQWARVAEADFLTRGRKAGAAGPAAAAEEA